MNNDQNHTPKYWIGHNVKDDDVFLGTACKSFSGARHTMITLFGEDWEENTDLTISLVEIKLVEI